MSTDLLFILALAAVVVAGVGFALTRRGRTEKGGEAQAKRARERDNLDTVAAWPPEATRLLTAGERSAHETLVKALPECMIFSQVPLARFIRVPRRNSYAEWLARVGNLSADFLICDRASLVIGAVSLQSMQETEGASRRRARMARVMKAAGIKVFVWREQAIPTAQAARDQITQRIGVPDGKAAPADLTASQSERPSRIGSGKLPIPEVVTDAPDDLPRRDPPPTTWFDDLDSSPTPLDPARKRPDA